MILGASINLSGNDESAIRARMRRATSAFHEWEPILTNKYLPVEGRAAAYKASVIASFCWQAQNWTPTAHQYAYIKSWASRHGSSMGFVRRSPTETLDSWWRRLHRDGHKFMVANNLVVTEIVKERKYSFAGHLARMDSGDVVNRILHARNLAWWRHTQSLSQTHSRKSGESPHPKRFCALARWESPFENFFGVHSAPAAADVVGWMQAAQDRQAWQRRCRNFVRD